MQDPVHLSVVLCCREEICLWEQGLGVGGVHQCKGQPGTASSCQGCTGRMRTVVQGCWNYNLPAL